MEAINYKTLKKKKLPRNCYPYLNRKFINPNTLNKRKYSTKVYPKYFINADLQKELILKEAYKTNGIHIWTNNINLKKYVVSALLEYYNVKRLLIDNSMPINVALLKYGYSNFSLTILEHCTIDALMDREKFYINLYSGEYNVLKEPDSPSRGKAWQHSAESIENMRENALNKYKLSLWTGNPKGIVVKDLNLVTNEITIYQSIRVAARAIGVNDKIIENYLYVDASKPILDKYLIELLSRNNKTYLQKTSKDIEVTNVLTGVVKVYPSIGTAAIYLKLHQAPFYLYIKDKRLKPFKDIYII